MVQKASPRHCWVSKLARTDASVIQKGRRNPALFASDRSVQSQPFVFRKRDREGEHNNPVGIIITVDGKNVSLKI